MSDDPIKPDEDADIIVHFITKINANTGEKKETWHVFHGQTFLVETDTEERAVTLACEAATARKRPAWLLDRRGYPLKAIPI